MALITDLTQYNIEREAAKEYYANLLILQYRNKPKARATIKLWVDLFLGDGLIFQLPDILDIDKAEGECLNIIGKILGCPRLVTGLLVDRKYFQFHQNENSYGFSRIGNPKRAPFKTIANSNLSAYELDDVNYKILLKFKAVANVLRGSIADIDNALYSVFGENVVLRSNQDLSIGYVVQTDATLAIQAARLLGYFKAPCGVKVDYVIAVPTRANANGFMIPMLIP